MKSSPKLWPVIVGIAVAVGCARQRGPGSRAAPGGAGPSSPEAPKAGEMSGSDASGGNEREAPASFFGLALDFTKAGAALYVLGLVISIAYYSQFNVVAFDVIRPHAILEGLSAMLILAAPPVLLLSSSRRTRRRAIWTLASLLLLATGNSILLLRLESRSIPVAAGFGSMLAVAQVVPFLTWPGDLMARSVSSSEVLPVGRARLVIGAIVALTLYIILIFPQLPAEYGGGRPYHVHLFPKTPNLVASRFARTKNMPQINKWLDSFNVVVLYESEKDFYLLEKRSSGAHTLEGYAVIRVPKAEVLRLDYSAPRWVHIEGSKP